MPTTVQAFKTGRKVREYRDHRLEWMIKSGGIEVVLAGLRDGNIRFPWPNPQ
jgi:RNA polymerase-associated protein